MASARAAPARLRALLRRWWAFAPDRVPKSACAASESHFGRREQLQHHLGRGETQPHGRPEREPGCSTRTQYFDGCSPAAVAVPSAGQLLVGAPNASRESRSGLQALPSGRSSARADASASPSRIAIAAQVQHGCHCVAYLVITTATWQLAARVLQKTRTAGQRTMRCASRTTSCSVSMSTAPAGQSIATTCSARSRRPAP